MDYISPGLPLEYQPPIMCMNAYQPNQLPAFLSALTIAGKVLGLRRDKQKNYNNTHRWTAVQIVEKGKKIINH